MNLISLLKYSKKKYPDKKALIEPLTKFSLTYKDFYSQIKYYATFLSDNGIKEKRKIALLLNNSIEAIILIYAILYIGAIPVFIDIKFTLREIRECLDITDTKTVIYSYTKRVFDILTKLQNDKKLKIFFINNNKNISSVDKHFFIHRNYVIDKVVSQYQFKTKLILFSYRGYGYPLAVVHTEQTLLHGVISSIKFTKSDSREIVSFFLPASHIFSLVTNIFAPLSIGATLVVFNNASPRIILQAFEEYKINFIIAVPTLIKVFLYLIKKNNIKLSFLKKGIVGADTLSKEILLEWKELTNCNLVEGFGLTETCPIVCNSWKENKVGSLGKPMDRVKIKILNKDGRKSKRGTLYVKSKSNFAYYLNSKKEFFSLVRNEWFDTGDRVEQDDEGFLFFKGRDKDIVKIGGSTVDLTEVKTVIKNILIKKVKKFTLKIVIKKDNLWNQKIICAITIFNGEIDKNSLITFLMDKCRENLASYKIPKKFIINKE